jgi:hypothetical protein
MAYMLLSRSCFWFSSGHEAWRVNEDGSMIVFIYVNMYNCPGIWSWCWSMGSRVGAWVPGGSPVGEYQGEVQIRSWTGSKVESFLNGQLTVNTHLDCDSDCECECECECDSD